VNAASPGWSPPRPSPSIHNAETSRWAGSPSVPPIAPPLETSSPLADLPARFNLRDLGGTPTADGRVVAPGRLYRGASMHRLEDDHLEAVAPLGIRTAIDLRSSEEVRGGTFAGSAAPVRHLPIFEVGPSFSDPVAEEAIARTLADAYLWMLSEGAGSIRASLELLGEPRDLPAVVYCAAGKDRTGVVIALVLGLLGVERDAVAADYALSDAPAAALRAWHLDNGASPDQLAAAGVFRAPAEAMGLFLDSLDREFGSLDGYVESLDLEVAGTRERLADALLTDA
jgi:protein-tyrosine phosphatase